MDHVASERSVAVIIVTYNSQACLPICLSALQEQTVLPRSIIVVDSGSAETGYVQALSGKPSFTVHLAKENIGFCEGNNRGMAFIPIDARYVLFLNPDAFLTPAFIEQAIDQMNRESSSKIGALTGLLLGYDLSSRSPTGQVDSAGVFRQWHGRWHDRGQGQVYQADAYQKIESIPAICGALMFCRKEALEEVLLGPCQVMDPSFYMYKEDIDLSLRLRRQGWTLMFNPRLIAYHCRGWKKNRALVPKRFRLLSARNEMRLHARLRSPYFFCSGLKYLLVKIFNL